jgi:N-acetylglucosaminyldiphosphoundecaprenol N-acetyl-beta-D-mannosaminyltransferase
LPRSSRGAALADPFAREVHCILGLPFDAIDLAGSVRRIQEAAARREKCFLSTPNLNWLVACQKDQDLRNSVIDSDLSIVDGMPLVWVARWLGVPIAERVAGSAVFDGLRASRAQPMSVFFFGGPEGIAEAACGRLNESVEGLSCAGYECPGFGTIEDMSSEATIAGINASGADFVVVALGAKKGQAWIERNRDRLSAPVISHLGAVVNFVAGTVSRAPVWMQRSGMEWLWRVKEETGLWRRYFSDGMVFLELLLTRVLPHVLLLRRHRPAPDEILGAGAVLRENADETSLELSGAWVEANLGPVRENFGRALHLGRDIRIDMAEVSHVDSAFVGLLLLLSGSCRRAGRRLLINRPNDAVSRIFRYSSADHLLRD